MLTTIQTFLRPTGSVAKGLLKAVLFGMIISSSVIPTGSLAFPNPVAPATAYAATCSIATAISDSVSSSNPKVGDTISFSLLGAPAYTAPTQVQVTDLVPAGLTFVSADVSAGTYDSATGIWDLGTLNGASVIQMKLTVTVNQGTEGQTITNTPSIKYVRSDCTQSSAITSASITVQGTQSLPSADLSASKSVDNATPHEGDTVHYTIGVKDNGPDDSTGVVATDTLPSGLTFVSANPSQGTYSASTGKWAVGNLSNGAQATLKVTATVNSGTAGKTIKNTVTAGESASQTDPNSANNTASASLTVQANNPLNADIAVAKSVDNATPHEGDTVHYTITATDNGPATSTGAVATDTLPSGLTYVSATTSQGTYSASTGAWTIGTLANGSSATLSITAKVNAGTAGQTITNTATVGESASVTDPNTANNSSSATLTVQNNQPVNADIAIAKAVDVSSTNEGGAVNYTITVTDNGPATSTGVVATDTLPSGTTLVSANPSQGTYSSSTGKWTIGTVANGAHATLKIAATVNSGTVGTAITNTATVSESSAETDTNLANNTATASFTVATGTCSVAAAFSDSIDDPNPSVGDVVTYTLLGAPALTKATHIIVTDQLGTGLTFVSSNPSTGTYSSSTGLWDLGTLNGASSVTLVLKASVNPGTEGQTITNTPTVKFVQSGCTQTAAVTGVSLTVQNGTTTTPRADIAVAKSVDNATPHEGDTVHYTITATDNGPDDSTGVVATDVLPSGVTYVSADPSQGTYSASNGTWTVGTVTNGSHATLAITATVDSGTAGKTITNTATVGESASTTDPNTANNSSSASIKVQQNPPVNADIAITKAVDVTSTNEGGAVNYTITVTDNGPATSTGVTVSETLPSGLTFVSSNPSQGTYSSSTGKWNVGTVAKGAKATLKLTATVNSGTVNTAITNTATVSESSSETDPNTANNTATASFTVVPGVCSVSGAFSDSLNDTNPAVGDTITYTLLGALALTAPTHVTVTDQLGSGLTFVSASVSTGTYSSSTGIWDLGTLNGASNVKIILKAKVNPGTEGQTITNTPTVKYVQSSCNQTAAVTGVSLTVQNPPAKADIAVKKTVDNSSPLEGDTIHYTIAVTDNGPAASTGVVATDTLPSGLTFVSASVSTGTYSTSTGAWTIGTVATNATATLKIAAKVNSGTASTTITNTATVGESASLTDPNTANNHSSVSITVRRPQPKDADIAVAKTVDDAAPHQGDTIHYTIAVTDNGPATSTGVVASDTLPSGLTFVSATTSQGTYSTSTGKWNVGTVGAHATATLVLAATVDGNPGTTITNTATVAESSSLNDPDLSNNSSSVAISVQGGGGCGSSCADIAVKKTADVATTTEGSIIHYTIKVTDNGPAGSTGVVATDTLPSGLTFVSATTSQGTYSTSTGAWTVGDVANGASATLAIVAKVNTGTASSTITNTATVAESANLTDPDASNNSSSVQVSVLPSTCTGTGCPVTADIAVVKTVDNDKPNPGDMVHFTVTVTDNGPDPASIVSVVDQLPPTMELSFVSATTSQGSPYNVTTGKWDVGTVAPNATATLQMTAMVGNNEAGKTIANTATVSELSSIIDPNPGNNSSTVTLNVQTPGAPDADLSVQKTVDNASPHEGDTIRYTIVLTDNGPATSTGVVATDTIPSGLTFVSATTSQGTYSTSTGAWTVGDLTPSSTANLVIAATVNSGTAGTTITNIAVASESTSTNDTDLSNNSSSVAINVQSNGCTSGCGGGGGGVSTAEIGIVKTVDNATPAPGAVIHYTLTVTASGPYGSPDVVANDTLPAGVTFNSASSSVGSYNSATGVWTIGNLGAGQTAVLVITATVNATDPVGEQITNTGTVTESNTVNDQNSVNNTSSVTITVGGQVLGASTSTPPGQVLGTSTCGIYLDQYIHPVRKYLNNANEVKKLQVFLNQNVGSNLPITGYYGPMTIAAVNQFQVKYHTEVLLPWVPLGLPNEYTPTSYVYQTTQRWINLIMCPSLNLPMPTLVVDTGE